MAEIPAFLLSQYEETAVLDDRPDPKTWIVRSRETGAFFVLKEVSADACRIARRRIGIRNMHLATVRDAFDWEQRFFVLQDYIAGNTLEAILAKQGLLSKVDALSYTVQLLEALEVVHREGIVHRDVTPANIIIGGDGILRLLDFGISRIQAPEKSRDTQILGTAGYAAPEQFGFRQTDARTDLYAVGVVMNQMLTGQFPNEKTPEEKALAWIVDKATALDPANRYESAAQMRREVRAALERARRQEELAVQNGQAAAGNPLRQGGPTAVGQTPLQNGGTNAGQTPIQAGQTPIQAGQTSERSGLQPGQNSGVEQSWKNARTAQGKIGNQAGSAVTHQPRNNNFTGNMDRRFRLPGFRTGRPWKQVVAVFIYLAVVVCIAVFIWDAATAGLKPALEIFGAVITFVAVPLLAGNMGYWDQSIPFLAKRPSAVRITIRVILAIILFLAGCIITTEGQGPR